LGGEHHGGEQDEECEGATRPFESGEGVGNKAGAEHGAEDAEQGDDGAVSDVFPEWHGEEDARVVTFDFAVAGCGGGAGVEC